MKDMVEVDRLKKAILERSYRENHENPFLLASGKYSPYYLDLKQVLFVPEYLEFACRLLLEQMIYVLGKPPAALAGLTMGADPLIYGISLLAHQKRMDIRPLIIRKEEKHHGSRKQIEGPMDAISLGDEIVLVDDVVTTGGSTLKAHRALKKKSFQAKFSFCLVDREEGLLDDFEREKIQLFSVFKLSDFRNKVD